MWIVIAGLLSACDTHIVLSFLFVLNQKDLKLEMNVMRLLQNRAALSTVVTTLIILVVSVLLATVVTFYAINVTTTRVQEESLHLTKLHIWYNTTGSWAQAAIVVLNTGGKDVVLDKISVRGQDCQWADIYYWRTDSVTVSNDLNVTADRLTGASASILVQNVSRAFAQADNDLTLKSGWTIVIYIMDPDSIALNDVGITCSLTAFTSNAQYAREVNIEAAQ